MTPTQGGFLRLDKETGAVSFCTVDAGLSVCRVSADERAALENEIARLRRDNAELKTAFPTVQANLAGPLSDKASLTLTDNGWVVTKAADIVQ